MSEARGKAHVHVVIVGFGAFEGSNKRIYDYDTATGLPTVVPVNNISPYLVEGPDIALPIRREPLCDVPAIVNGNKPVDGGFLIVEPSERDEFLRNNPEVAPYLRVYLSAEELINGSVRYILWLRDAPPDMIRRSPDVVTRLEGVRDFRANSQKIPTRAKAATPSIFDQVRQPSTTYLAIPKTSSEQRTYIPMLVIEPEVIASTELQMIPEYDDYIFGILTSVMHMAWMRQVCGRLESRFRYSNKIVYNNFPWPNPTPEQRARVEEKARVVLAAREPHLPPRGMSTLADLYDPLTMPAALAKAHADLDKAVEKCYRPEPFHSDRERVEHLFRLYEQLTAPLLPATPKTRGRRSKAVAAKRRPRRGRTPGLPAAEAGN